MRQHTLDATSHFMCIRIHEIDRGATRADYDGQVSRNEFCWRFTTVVTLRPRRQQCRQS